MSNVIEFLLDGKVVVLDVDLDTSITDLTSDMDTIASQIAWYGRILASAERAAERADIQYRSWRAHASNQALSRDPKLAEHKIKIFVESQPLFIQHKELIASAEELVTRMQKAVVALQVKADILRSRGAIARAEWHAIGMNTPSVESVVDRPRRRGTVVEGNASPDEVSPEHRETELKKRKWKRRGTEPKTE